MAEMIKLFVNGQEVEVESGKNLIDAVGAVGIEIPHLCYHPALGADGNCRMCLVGIEDGRPPLVPACKTRAVEGMKVQLDTEKIKKIQRDIMELELINHPTDCPICDQAGECQLQDYYMQYDAHKSRMTVPPVAKSKKMDFGSGVVHDQERCVLCARCVRFTRMITKTGELGIVNRTDYARVTIFPGRPLANRYALNVVDLCPVGAMTSSDFRFKQRAWFLTNSKGICHGCAKGCNIYIDHNKEKYKEDIIYRFRPRFNDQVNGYFMCDEGRMTYKLENEQRLTQPKLNDKNTDSASTVEGIRRALSQAVKALFVVSPNCSLEEMRSIQQLASSMNASLSGYSDGYIKKGDGDDFLIKDDKSANRSGLNLLGIDSSQNSFEMAVAEADLLVSFQNDLTRTIGAEQCARLKEKMKLVYLSSYSDGFAEMATSALPVASYSEKIGTIINADNILQRFEVAVVKNAPPVTLIQALAQLGGKITTLESAWDDLSSSVDDLNKVDFAQIPEQGLALTDSEVSNVAA
jgi:NADH-quinone oxidoreductase subunit G